MLAAVNPQSPGCLLRVNPRLGRRLISLPGSPMKATCWTILGRSCKRRSGGRFRVGECGGLPEPPIPIMLLTLVLTGTGHLKCEEIRLCSQGRSRIKLQKPFLGGSFLSRIHRNMGGVHEFSFRAFETTLFFFVGGNTQWWSGIPPGSNLRNYSWRAEGPFRMPNIKPSFGHMQGRCFTCCTVIAQVSENVHF